MVVVEGPSLAVRTCARRLSARLEPTDVRLWPAAPGFEVMALTPAGGASSSAAPIECRVSWFGPAAVEQAGLGSEAAVQAMSGLMHLHGLDRGGPRRLAIDAASVVAGLVAAQGALAALAGLDRGRPVSGVETSALQAALLTISQYVARATCDEGPWSPPPGGDGYGPPFPTADGRWVELETLSPRAWTAFWTGLGVAPGRLVEGWTAFGARYSTARCSMPAAFHEATSRRSLAEISTLASETGVSLCPVRRFDEVCSDARLLPALVDGAARWSFGGDGEGPSPRDGTGKAAGRGVAPLEGVTVVEATSRIQGPLAGQLLRMLGARVVRVEPPGGDVARMESPLAGDEGAFFTCMNRGKQAVEIDLSRPSGRDELRDLVGGAEAFLHNWRPGKAQEWGLAADDLAAVRPQLVYCGASGWGPLAGGCPEVGMEFLVQAYSGLGDTLNPAGDPPLGSRVLLVDVAGALVACEGVVSGIGESLRTGRGCEVEASLLAGALALQAHLLGPAAGDLPVGRSPARPAWGPLDQPLPTRDGYLALTAGAESLAGLCRACDVDPDAGEREALVAERIRDDAGEVWAARLAGAGVPAAPVCTDVGAMACDPRLKSLFEPIGGTSVAPRAPWCLS